MKGRVILNSDWSFMELLVLTKSKNKVKVFCFTWWQTSVFTNNYLLILFGLRGFDGLDGRIGRAFEFAYLAIIFDKLDEYYRGFIRPLHILIEAVSFYDSGHIRFVGIKTFGALFNCPFQYICLSWIMKMHVIWCICMYSCINICFECRNLNRGFQNRYMIFILLFVCI